MHRYVASHVVPKSLLPKIVDMVRLPQRIAVLFLSLATGLALSGSNKHLTHKHRPPQPDRSTISTPALPDTNNIKLSDDYPETVGVSPYDIEYFIEDHPQSDLSRLWQRLGVPLAEDNSNDKEVLRSCNHCKADRFQYDLDGEPGDEVLLRISDRLSESYTFLVLQMEANRSDYWKLLGHINAWGKYKSAQHTILIADGRPWLIIQGQGASGSGVALYIDRVFEVTKRGLRQVATYPSGGFQSGIPDGPTKEFSGRLISCQVKGNQAIVTIEFAINYSIWSVSERQDRPLFNKRQKAILTRSMGSERRATVDRTRSEVSQHELESVFNIDSMTEADFLKYNYSQLLEIAGGRDGSRKRWLRTYLQTCDNSPEKRALAQLVHAN